MLKVKHTLHPESKICKAEKIHLYKINSFLPRSEFERFF